MGDRKSIISGIARNVSWKKEGAEYSVDVLTFRVERVDNEGNVIDYMPVRMEGLIKGNLVDGDEVEVAGEIDDDGLLNAKSIYNMRTKSYIRTRKTGLGLLVVPFIFISLFIISVILGGIAEQGKVLGPMTGLVLLLFILAVISFGAILIVSALRK